LPLPLYLLIYTEICSLTFKSWRFGWTTDNIVKQIFELTLNSFHSKSCSAIVSLQICVYYLGFVAFIKKPGVMHFYFLCCLLLWRIVNTVLTSQYRAPPLTVKRAYEFHNHFWPSIWKHRIKTLTNKVYKIKYDNSINVIFSLNSSHYGIESF
jgi:hypothetical protein